MHVKQYTYAKKEKKVFSDINRRKDLLLRRYFAFLRAVVVPRSIRSITSGRKTIFPSVGGTGASFSCSEDFLGGIGSTRFPRAMALEFSTPSARNVGADLPDRKSVV